VKLSEIIDILGAEVMLNEKHEDISIEMACGSDLMSDVLAFAKPGALLLTGLTTAQVIYTAEMADIKVVCFVRGKKPIEETVALAADKDMILISTKLPMFEGCGRLYKHGLKGCSGT
jgi:xanthine dehydrogenase iron-sulfur cluster and FAD-binding subunit A